MKKITRYIFGALFAILVASPVLAITSPVQPSASALECEQRFLGIPPWFRGMTKEESVNGKSTCVILSPEDPAIGGLSQFIWKLVLNVIEMALVAVAYLAIFFIIYGGFQFVTGGSSSDTVAKARKTVLNAVIGLIIALGAIAITNYVFGIFDGASGNATIGGSETGIQSMSSEQLLGNILKIVFFVLGILSVVVIVVSGMMYVTSSGDSGRVSKAKSMLTYSIVGLIVAISAFAITNFVIGRFS